MERWCEEERRNTLAVLSLVAFLHAELTKLIYFSQHEGFEDSQPLVVNQKPLQVQTSFPTLV